MRWGTLPLDVDVEHNRNARMQEEIACAEEVLGGTRCRKDGLGSPAES
jgi:hypothetical protein